jgi:hypothetical protein
MTPEQQAENARTLIYLAKQGSKPAKEAITKDGGKK